MKECIQIHSLYTTVQNLPELPGVYRFLDSLNQVLYVGKARNIKRRVLSYFSKNVHSPRIALMVKKILAIEITVTRSENEALLLENNLIKALNPRYNILFRDDKTYPYLQLSSHPFPRMVYYRGNLDKKNLYFGPFPSAWAVRESIHVLQKIFKLRVCEDSVFSHRSRPCLLYSVGRCSAPCTGKISAVDYISNVELARGFLSGKHSKLIRELENKMHGYSVDLAFEKAAVVRNQLVALSRILEKQSIDIIDSSDVDIIAVGINGNFVCVTLAMVRGGRHLGDKAYFPEHFNQAIIDTDLEQEAIIEGNTSEESLRDSKRNNACSEILQTFILQHYIDIYIPNVLVLSHPLLNKNFDFLLSEHYKKKISITTHPKDQRKIWLNMAKNSAELSLSKLISKKINGQERAISLIKALKLDISYPEDLHIECFDVSHTSGEATQASCVVYRGCAMRPSDYRRYSIRSGIAGDDYGAMRQAIERHYKKKLEYLKLKEFSDQDSFSVSREEGVSDNNLNIELSDNKFCSKKSFNIPNLVLVDGGKGQVELTRQIFSSLGCDISVIVGVAKGEGRKVGYETLIFADGRPPLTLGKESIALLLITQIRDEAHRFAITGMRASRQKNRDRSQLEDIEGIGQKRRQRLLSHFGGLRGVQTASVNELAAVDGISKNLAENIHRHLH